MYFYGRSLVSADTEAFFYVIYSMDYKTRGNGFCYAKKGSIAGSPVKPKILRYLTVFLLK